MKWYAISGSWRTTNKQVERDVIDEVTRIINRGDGIITGGALGVDYIATQTALNIGNPVEQLKIYLPIKLDAMCGHYLKRAGEGVITQEQAEMITSQLRRIHELHPDCILDEWGYTEANVDSYYARNTKIIEDSDGLCAFHVNDSKGTQDAINKAKDMGKLRYVKKYYIK
jgi:hypothetical protein